MAPATAVETGTDYGNAGPIPLSSPTVTAGISPEPAPESSGFPGTSPTPIPTPAPAAPGAAYNPLSAQPYTAPTAVPVQPVPQATPLGPEQQAPGAANHLGAAAYLGDQVLRGYMQGKAQAQMVQAARLYKQSSGLQKNLDMASQQYYALMQRGADPNSPEVQDAKTQVDAAFQANMDFMKQHVAGQQIDKKTGQLKPQQGSILERLTKQDDPAAQSLAVYQAAQALGPPVYHQTAAFATPQYRQYAQTQAQAATLTGQNALAAQQITAQKATIQKEFNDLNAIPYDQLTDVQRERRDQLGDFLGTPTEASAAKSELLRRTLADPTISDAERIRRVQQISGKGQGAFTPTARLATAGSFGEQLDRVAADHHISRADIPPEVVDAYRQRWAYDNQVATSTTRTGTIDTVDAAGNPTKTPIELPGSRGPSARPAIPSGWGDPAEAAIPSSVTHPVAITAGTQAYTRAANTGATPAQASTAARVAANTTQRSLVKLGTPIPTGKNRQQTPDETEVYKDEDNMGLRLKDAEEAAQLTNKAAGDSALSTAFAHSLVNGRLSNFDIQRFSNLGSARVRMEGSVAKAIDGTMTDEQRQMILDNMRINYQNQHILANHYRNRDPGYGQRSIAGAAPSGGGAGASTPAFDPSKDFIPIPAGAH